MLLSSAHQSRSHFNLDEWLLLAIEAEENIINRKAPFVLLEKAKSNFLNASKLDIDRKDALENLSRALWQEYKWRISDTAVNCKSFQKDIAPIKHSLEQHTALPFVRYYYIHLLSVLQRQSQCGIATDIIQQQIRLLKTEHAVVANKLKQEIY